MSLDGTTITLVLPEPAEIGLFAEVIRRQRVDLGLSQNDLAGAMCQVWRPTVTGNEIARYERGERIARPAARRALEQVLGLPVFALDIAAANQRAARRSATDLDAAVVDPVVSVDAVGRIRASFLDSAGIAALGTGDANPPGLDQLDHDLDQVMVAYQAGQFDRMTAGLAPLIADAHRAARAYEGDDAPRAKRALALTGQASAMVLTKLGEHDLAWIASERGLMAAHDAASPAVLGSLRRSMVHSLQSAGRNDTATRLAERTADELRGSLDTDADHEASVYGTLLLAASMPAARTGDRSGVDELLDEAEHYANRMGRDANHLWTAFGPTNVTVHRVATAVAMDDVARAERHTSAVDVAVLPIERRIRYLFDVAMIAVRRDRTDEAIATMLEAEQLGPEQVHSHVMAQQIVGHLRGSKAGRQDPRLAQLDRRTRKAQAAA